MPMIKVIWFTKVLAFFFFFFAIFFFGGSLSLCGSRCVVTYCVNDYCLTAAQIPVILPPLGWAFRFLVHVYNLCNLAIILLPVLQKVRWRNPTRQRSMPSAIHYTARADSSLPSISICTCLILTTAFSSKTLPQTSCSSQDLPRLSASIPTVSIVMPTGCTMAQWPPETDEQRLL